jgi:hypothetical protein
MHVRRYGRAITSAILKELRGTDPVIDGGTQRKSRKTSIKLLIYDNLCFYVRCIA